MCDVALSTDRLGYRVTVFLNGGNTMAQHIGKVAWFNAAKGYGFVKAERIQDVFCHYSGIQGDGYKKLEEGEAVEFDVVQGEKGLQAANVRRLTLGA